jgi:hypothetical protein
MSKTREEHRQEAVEQAEETLLGQFAAHTWKWPSGPATFRRVLEGLWDDGALLGGREATTAMEQDARAVMREQEETAALRNWDEGGL